MSPAGKLSQVLRSLIPTNPHELTLLQWVFSCAEKLRETDVAAKITGAGPEVEAFLQTIPADAERYFHGLLEALDIYQSIHGRALPINNLSLSDSSFQELRQIRDICLQEGLHSVY